MNDPNLLIGTDHFSDAGVYRLADHLAIVQTVDFFSPIVDDPYTFGQIAAANALSDCYAMGAQPRTVLNIVGFPDGDLELDVLTEILRGGAERVLAAGAVVVGGHSVRDSEVKYGLAVTGTVDPALMLTNAGARAGDALVLTKPLGTGFITTAAGKGSCPDDVMDEACRSMVQLNAPASAAALELQAHGSTDVTGFGLAVHAMELAEASGVSIVLRLSALPLLPGAAELASPEHFSSASSTNRARAEQSMRIESDAIGDGIEMLFDPQTSGGLLLAIDPATADALVQRCRDGGLGGTAIIGEVTERQSESIIVRS